MRRPIKIKDDGAVQSRNLTGEPRNCLERSDFCEGGKAAVSPSDGRKDARRGEVTPRVLFTSPTSASAS